MRARVLQYHVALHLLSHPGDIVQLHMGEGKTRVSLPLLILHWANGNNLVSGRGNRRARIVRALALTLPLGCVFQVRLNLLPTLLEEAYSHLRTTLSSSVLARKLFTMPFHRDVCVTSELLAVMQAALEHCMQVRSAHAGGGAVM